MKLATIEFVQRLGLKAMRTTNDTVNYPMVAVNEKLGYRRLPARVAMKLTNLAAQESLEQSPAGGKVRDPILRRGRALEVKPLRGYEPEIGGWLWMMEQVRRRTLELVAGLDQETLDWEGPDGGENAIGSLLYHIALVEMSWLFLDIFGQEFPPEVKSDFPHEMADAEGRLARVPGGPLSEHLRRLHRSRAVFLEKLRPISLKEWRRLRHPPDDVDYDVTPEWAVFHLIEHEAGHAFQISALKARSARLFARRAPR